MTREQEYTEGEILRMRAEQEEMARAGWPLVGRPAAGELEAYQRKIIWMKAIQRDLQNMAGNKTHADGPYLYNARDLWVRIQRENADWTEQALQKYAAHLLEWELITGPEDIKKVRAMKFYYVDPVQLAEQQAALARVRELDDTIQQILSRVEPARRQEALNIYNSRLSGAKSDEKLTAWAVLLMESGLLPAGFLPQRFAGSIVAFFKKLAGHYQNKAIYPESNK